MILRLLQKKKLLVLAFFALSFFSFVDTVSALDRYWVGSTATWDGSTTSNWSSSSGGASGASVPTQYDNVFFDSNSGSGTVTLSSSSAALNLDFSGFTGTISHPHSTSITVNGSLILGLGMTYSLVGTGGSAQPRGVITFNSTTTGNTITTNGIVVGSLTFNGLNGGWTFQDNVTTSFGAITLTAGSLDTNSKTVAATQIASTGSSVRSLTLGASTITLTNGLSLSLWNVASTGFTLSAASSDITLNGSGAIVFAGAGLTYGDVIIMGSLTTPSITGANTFGSLTITGTSIKTEILSLSADQTVSGALTINGNSSTNRILIASNTLGTSRTITANDTISAPNVDFRDITGAGSASWDLSAATGGSGDALGNSGITFTPAQTNYWVGNGGSWSDSTHWASSSGGTGGTGRVPLPQDDVRFDTNSFSSTGQVVTADMPRQGTNVNWIGTLFAPQWKTNVSATNNTVYGSITFSSGGMSTAGGTIIMECRTTCSLDTAGQAFSSNLHISAYGGTINLASSLLGTATLVSNFGTFSANNYNVTMAAVQFNSSVGPKILNMGSGTWTLTSTGVWVCTSGSGTTINAQSSTILISNTSTSAKTFTNSCNNTYNNLTISGGGSGAVLFTQNTTSNIFTIGAPKTITFTSGTTQRVNRFVALGTASNPITLNASTGGSVATLSMPGANTFAGDYLAITDLNATGGAKWYAGANSTLSNSTGWLLQAGPQRRGSFIQDAKVRLEKGKMIIRGR